MNRNRSKLVRRIESNQTGFIWNPLREIKSVTIEEIDEAIAYFSDHSGFLSKDLIKVVVVLDRHIGDSLSLFSTHIRYLAAHPRVELTIDASRCPLLRTVTKVHIRRMLPKDIFAYWSDIPLDYEYFDVIFDPYDVVDGVWSKKFQNDSAHVGIVTGLEFLKARVKNKRRSIIDVHMTALKRSGFVASDILTPEFVRYNKKISKSRLVQKDVRLVLIFPFGLTPDRKYPANRLREVICAICTDSNVKVVLSGSYEDTPGIIDGIVGNPVLAQLREEGRIALSMNRTFGEVIDLMMASGLVVSMDSGPLHIARMLRLDPIALYTSKVNDEEQMKDFLWFVDDGTATCLVPKKGDMHVKAKELVRAIKKRL